MLLFCTLSIKVTVVRNLVHNLILEKIELIIKLCLPYVVLGLTLLVSISPFSMYELPANYKYIHTYIM